jgi:adenylate cyclase
MDAALDRRLAAILSADIEGYSRLIRLDEERTVREVQAHLATATAKISEFGGRLINTMGDGFLAEFASVVGAVRCAVGIQEAINRRNHALAADQRALLRIGINQGEVVSDNGAVFGDGINVAARLQAIAEPGGIAITARVHEDVAGKVEIEWADIGDQTFKNIDRAIRAYRSTSPGSVYHDAPKPSEKPSRSIVVLPFTNMSGDLEQEYFSDGITEDIITDLSKISQLHVVARNTAFTFKGRSMRIEQVARELGVRYVLEGSVRKAGPRIRVTGQLIDGRNGGHLWAERYDRDLTDIFSIQDEITQAIVTQLKVKLLPEERQAISRPSTDNIEAYTFFVRGRQFALDWTKPHLLVARRMFAKAVELDPLYAKAHAGIAACECGLYEWTEVKVSLDSLLELSDTALALDPNLAEAHAARGFAFYRHRRFDEAKAAFDRAIALDANLYEAHFFFARMAFMQGHWELALSHFLRAAELRPEDCVSPIHIMTAYLALGRPAERAIWARIGVERCERAIALHPQLAGPYHRGALALAHLGERDRARSWAACAVLMDPDDIVCSYNVVCTYSLLGDIDEALDVFERFIRVTRDMDMWWEHDSDLDPIRSHPRFKQLTKRRTGGAQPVVLTADIVGATGGVVGRNLS